MWKLIPFTIGLRVTSKNTKMPGENYLGSCENYYPLLISTLSFCKYTHCTYLNKMKWNHLPWKKIITSVSNRIHVKQHRVKARSSAKQAVSVTQQPHGSARKRAAFQEAPWNVCPMVLMENLTCRLHTKRNFILIYLSPRKTCAAYFLIIFTLLYILLIWILKYSQADSLKRCIRISSYHTSEIPHQKSMGSCKKCRKNLPLSWHLAVLFITFTNYINASLFKAH